MTECREFRITVPEEHVVRYDRRTWQRAQATLERLCEGHEVTVVDDYEANWRTFSGSAPVEAVTLIAAIAQGHDLTALLEQAAG